MNKSVFRIGRVQTRKRFKTRKSTTFFFIVIEGLVGTVRQIENK